MAKPRPWILWTLAIVFALLLLTVGIGLFAEGHDLYALITGLLTPLIAFIAAFAMFLVWRIEKDVISKGMWAGLGLGFLAWALADTVWSVYDLILHQDIPYPSLADLFWAGGYVFFFIALAARLQNLPVKPNKGQTLVILGMSVFWVAMTVIFVLQPIIGDFDPQRLWEGVLNIFFPVADAAVAVMCTILLILLGLGRFSLSWRWIFAGMFLMTASDLIYSFATWRELYFPEGRVNLISAFIDVTYIAAYLLAGLGAFIYKDIATTRKAASVNLVVKSVSRYYAMLFTNRNHQIISASTNLPVLLNAQSMDDITGHSLSQVLRLKPEMIEDLCARLAREAMLKNEPLTIYTHWNEPRDVWLTAVAAYDLHNQFNGANIALRANIIVPEEQRLPGQKELQFDLRHLLTQAGLLAQDESQSMRTYFVDGIQVLSDLVTQFGGEPFQKSLFNDMRDVVEENDLPVQIDGLSVTVQEDLDTRQLAEILHLLLDVAERFVSDVVGEDIVREEMSTMERELDPAVLKDVKAYRLSKEFISPAP